MAYADDIAARAEMEVDKAGPDTIVIADAIFAGFQEMADATRENTAALQEVADAIREAGEVETDDSP